MAETNRANTEIFDGGPPLRLEKSLGLIKPNQRRTLQRATLAVLILWAPLYFLTAIESLASGENKLSSLIVDLTVDFRYLIAVPIFILAESITLPRLGEIARHFIDSGFVTASDRARFDAIAAQARRLLYSVLAEVLVIIMAYLVVVILIRNFPDEDIPVWHKLAEGGFSWAGWWHVWVSIPVSLVLLFGWLWRILLWGFFLCRVSRLDLQLIPAHPDRAGGLQFVGLSVRAFLPVGFALSAIVAGGVAERIMRYGTPLLSFKYIIIAVVVGILVLFVGPILVFAGKLIEARRRGTLSYGALAGAVGRQMERKWIEQIKDVDERALDVQHFSATTDLYQVVSNVYQMKTIPLDLQDLIAMTVAVLLPFLPALLFAIPLNEILSTLVKVMF